MHIDDAARRKKLKELTVEMAGQVIKRRQELADAPEAARKIFQALVDAPTWTIANSPKPQGPWREPDEIWSEPTKIVKP
jgi:hypothetical protein